MTSAAPTPRPPLGPSDVSAEARQRPFISRSLTSTQNASHLSRRVITAWQSYERRRKPIIPAEDAA
jgi:hypothetical protein